MNTSRNWFRSSKATLSVSRRKLSPMIEVVEDRKLMTVGVASGFLAGSVLLDGGSGAGVSFVKIDLYQPGRNTPIATQTTDANGQYLFTGLGTGDYLLKETVPSGYSAMGNDIHSQLNPASSVDSQTIKVSVVDPSNVYVNYGGIINGSFGVVNDVVKGSAIVNSVGPMSDTLGTSPGDTSLNSGFHTFCVNDLQNLSFAGGESYRVTPRPISQLNDGTGTISADHSGRIAYLFNHYGNSSLTNVQGPGLQLAIWELLYDKGSTPDFTQGAFQVTGSDPNYTDQATLDHIITQAKSYYAESSGHSETGVFLDAASANPGKTDGLQSVLSTGSLNFNLGKPMNTCDLTNVYYVINGSTVVTDLRGHVHAGDTVEADFTIPSGSTDKLSLVSYTAPQSYFDANTASAQKVFCYTTQTFGAGNHSVTVKVPNSNFQVDFVCGDVITTFGPAGSNNFYHAQGRFISGDNGGPGIGTGGGSGCDTGSGGDHGKGDGSSGDTGSGGDHGKGNGSGGDHGKGDGSGCDTGSGGDHGKGGGSGDDHGKGDGSGGDTGSGGDHGKGGGSGGHNNSDGDHGSKSGGWVSSCGTGGWGGGLTSVCNVGSGKGWSFGNSFSWCKL